MPMSPDTIAFTIFLGVLAALPSFAIDMTLPALPEIGRAFQATSAEAGATLSWFMVGFALSPLVYGPLSDRWGRKPVMTTAVAMFAVASAGCAASPNLPVLLACRLIQGAGAGASLPLAMAVIRDLFEGEKGRARTTQMGMAMTVVPAIAPTGGAVLLSVGGWRSIHAGLTLVGVFLLMAAIVGFSESARIDGSGRLTPAGVARGYLRVLMNRACVGSILTAAASFGALFSYVSGSSLYLIGACGLPRAEYGLVFAITSIAIMVGALVSEQMSNRGWAAGAMLLGLCAAIGAAATLLGMAAWGSVPLPAFVAVITVATAAFGMVAPSAMHDAMQPLPELAGATGAVMGCVQMLAGSLVSWAVSAEFDGRSALSMAGMMLICSAAALLCRLLVRRPIRDTPQAVAAVSDRRASSPG